MSNEFATPGSASSLWTLQKKWPLRTDGFSAQYATQFTHRPSPRKYVGGVLVAWAGSTRSVKDDLFQQGVLT